jgi:hypothetical protein
VRLLQCLPGLRVLDEMPSWRPTFTLRGLTALRLSP